MIGTFPDRSAGSIRRRELAERRVVTAERAAEFGRTHPSLIIRALAPIVALDARLGRASLDFGDRTSDRILRATEVQRGKNDLARQRNAARLSDAARKLREMQARREGKGVDSPRDVLPVEPGLIAGRITESSAPFSDEAAHIVSTPADSSVIENPESPRK